jgi:hypothetical protein
MSELRKAIKKPLPNPRDSTDSAFELEGHLLRQKAVPNVSETYRENHSRFL